MRFTELLDDPTLDAVYISLPNSHHYEWALKALQAKKHVLLEKPSCSNSAQAQALFESPLLTASSKNPNPPILLEAFHTIFHPAFNTFLSLLNPANIIHASSMLHVFAYLFSRSDIRFSYPLAGGTLMDLGTYPIIFLRKIFAREPVRCLEAKQRLLPQGWDQNCEEAMTAKWDFGDGRVGKIDADLRKRGGWPLKWLTGSIPSMGVPYCAVTHKEMPFEGEDDETEEGQEHVYVRKVTIWNMMVPHIWHRIDVVEEHAIRDAKTGVIHRKWEEREEQKAYTWGEEAFDMGLPGDAEGANTWTTYRYQLEEWVNRIREREGSGVWLSGEESIKQMEMIDSAYKCAGMKIRPGEV